MARHDWRRERAQAQQLLNDQPELVGDWKRVAVLLLPATASAATLKALQNSLKNWWSRTKGKKPVRKIGSDTEIKVTTTTHTNQYDNDPEAPLVLNAWDPDTNQVMDIEQYCKRYNLPYQNVRSCKLVTHTGTPYYNIAFDETKFFEKDMTEALFTRVIKELTKGYPRRRIAPKEYTTGTLVRLIISDTHIAMETDESGFGLYGGVWNAKELMERKETIVEALADYLGELHIIDLGDLMDGWNAHTVRQQHPLPQNMDNEEAFEVGCRFKVSLVDAVVELGNFHTVKLYNICNDNHSGAFGYVVNHAVKLILEAKYADIKIHNLRKFINHYTWNNHAFIMSHGKDAKHLKFGFPVHLDKKGKDKIEEYIRFEKLEGYQVTFEKGDSHQMLLDYCSASTFDYFNYPALSPSSEWIQTNYTKGRSGFVIMEIHDERKTVTPYWFDWAS